MKQFNCSSEQDELKRLTNRCVGKLLDKLGNSINDAQISLIKEHIRVLANNICKNIFNAGQSNDTTTQINQ